MRPASTPLRPAASNVSSPVSIARTKRATRRPTVAPGSSARRAAAWKKSEPAPPRRRGASTTPAPHRLSVSGRVAGETSVAVPATGAGDDDSVGDRVEGDADQFLAGVAALGGGGTFDVH